ncbi:hypothetical protein D6833_02090 [Candidatus Parcubacteria bacterium]|nr:MAG: hypothetical protein D6833_02090 [Candidatus Parcubacteria bacterium]
MVTGWPKARMSFDPSVSKGLTTFIDDLKDLQKDAIQAAAAVEPCGVSDVRLDEDGVFRGCINFRGAGGNYYPGPPPACQQWPEIGGKTKWKTDRA